MLHSARDMWVFPARIFDAGDFAREMVLFSAPIAATGDFARVFRHFSARSQEKCSRLPLNYPAANPACRIEDSHDRNQKRKKKSQSHF